MKRSQSVIVSAVLLCAFAWAAGCGGGGGGASLPKTYSGERFALVVLPDTQLYSHLYPDIFSAQTQWIADNVNTYNIRYVLHEGDMVNIPGPTNGQWENAVRSMNILDGKVPYALAIGNHDYDDEGATRASTRFNQFFPWSKFSAMPTFGGAFEQGKMDNTYHLFRAGDTDWLILCLEFGPRSNVLAWADQIAKQYANRRVMVVTHSYLYYDNSLLGSDPAQASLPDNMGIASQAGGVNNGSRMWGKFISQNPNIQFVFNGHTGGDGTGRLVSKGIYGNSVYQMLANYQYEENGGNGYLRLIMFNPKEATVSVKTYSPVLKQLREDSENQFEFYGVEFGRM